MTRSLADTSGYDFYMPDALRNEIIPLLPISPRLKQTSKL